jgi:hypothetical protein
MMVLKDPFGSKGIMDEFKDAKVERKKVEICHKQ